MLFAAAAAAVPPTILIQMAAPRDTTSRSNPSMLAAIPDVISMLELDTVVLAAFTSFVAMSLISA
jgi:hypothetical protein